MNRTVGYPILFTLLILVTVALFASDLVFGSVHISLTDLISGDDATYREIVYNFRLPKALTAIITGIAISLAGMLMQTLFKNPLADPYVLGVSSGAGLGVAIFLLGGSLLPTVLTQSGWGLVIAAIIGAVLVMLLVIAVSFRVSNSVSLLIVGIMFGQVAGSLISILQNSSNPDSLKLFVVWTFGSLSAVTWNYMQVMFPIVLLGIILVFSMQKSLNALLVGEHYAQGLGVNIVKIRVLIVVTTALLAGATTAFTGPIAFLGIAVPHLARGIFRTSNHKIIVPATMLCGAALMLFCDLVTQMPSNGYTLPINAISALVGAPFIIYIILKNR